MLKLILQNTNGPLPTSTYILLNNGTEVGMIQIRHQPSHSQEVPSHFSNHIYYEIKPEFRGQGFGTEILKLGIEEAKKIGLKKIVVTCYEENIASKKIIENNGGILVDKCVLTDEKVFLKYEIKVSGQLLDF